MRQNPYLKGKRNGVSLPLVLACILSPSLVVQVEEKGQGATSLHSEAGSLLALTQALFNFDTLVLDSSL